MLFMILLMPSILYAQVSITKPVTEASSSTPLKQPLLERIENPEIKHYLGELASVQSSIGGYVQNIGDGLDRFFGSEDLDIISQKSQLKIQTPITFYDDEVSESKWRFKFYIDLPRTNHRWKLFFSSIDDDSSVGDADTPNTEEKRLTRDDENRLGGRFLVKNKENRLANFDTGLKFVRRIEPNPFIKYEDRFTSQLAMQVSSRSTQTLYLEREDGFAWEAEQVFDKALDRQNLLRSQSQFTWWRNDREVLLNQRFIYFYKPNVFRANAYYINAYWLADNQALDFNSVAIGMNWREQLYKDWLFAEVEPRFTWLQQANNRLGSAEPSLRLMLEMSFYR